MKSFSYINRNDISANWALINVDHSIGFKLDKKRRNATKPGFQRFNQVFMWQE